MRGVKLPDRFLDRGPGYYMAGSRDAQLVSVIGPDDPVLFPNQVLLGYVGERPAILPVAGGKNVVPMPGTKALVTIPAPGQTQQVFLVQQTADRN